MKTGLLIVGHGSRALSANHDFEALVADFRQLSPELDVAHAYVELCEPALSAALLEMGRRTRRVVVLPLFLFGAGHVKNDIPMALEAARAELPHVQFLTAPALGVHAELVALVHERALAVVPTASAPDKTAVLVVGRGSSDPDANGDFCKLVRLFAEGTSYLTVAPAFIGITGPRVEAALEALARARPEAILVVPYFLFSGRLEENLRELAVSFGARHPWIQLHVARTLGSCPRLHAAMRERLEQALNGSRPLPCDTCQYRVPIAQVTQNVGGLRALLWSLRHAFTHTQAKPHAHAHAAIKKHVLICGNADCAERGSVALLSTLRRLVKRAGRSKDIRITRTHCMGRCGEGPALVVYPDGIWYRGMTANDADELLSGHLLGDRLLEHRVDNIMQ